MFLQNIKQYNCFNIDNNNKCFLSSKLAYYNDFWRIMWKAEKKIQLGITGINYILKYFKIENSYLIWYNQLLYVLHLECVYTTHIQINKYNALYINQVKIWTQTHWSTFFF